MSLTPPFRTTSGDYLKVILLFWTVRHGWMVILPILAALTVAVVNMDLRWAIVGLAGVFIIVPMLMSMIYIYYMLTPEARRAVALKQVETTSAGDFRLIYLEPGEDEDTFSETGCELIPRADIIKVYRIGRFDVYRLRAPRLQLLLIPHDNQPIT